jgi:hypothetical protein
MKRITTIEEYNDAGELVKRTVTEEDGVQDIKYVPQPMPVPAAPTIPWWNDKVWCGVDTGRNPVPFSQMMLCTHGGWVDRDCCKPPDPRSATKEIPNGNYCSKQGEYSCSNVGSSTIRMGEACCKLYGQIKLVAEVANNGINYLKCEPCKDAFLREEAVRQARRDANGNLLLPEDDDPADAELIPEELRE